MPQLPLPTGESCLSGGDVPVIDGEQVIAEFPRPHKNPAVAPVRDAFVAGWSEGLKAYQNIAARAAAQCDPLRATGDYLRAYAEERSVIPGAAESEESIRSRLFAAPKIVAPDVIVDGVNELMAPYTAGTCQLSELELDGYFVHDGTGTWDSFIGGEPDYPDRYYDDVPSLLPGGAVPSSGLPRSFLLRIPSLDDNDDTVSFVLNDDAEGLFVGDGTNTGGSESDSSVALSVFVNPQLANELYAQICGFVESVKGQGISYTLLVDPTL